MYYRSFLKWAGSKYSSLQDLLPLLPDADRFIEPFLGSGTVFINTHYNSYILADSNEDLINLFNCIKDNNLDFIDYCQEFFAVTNNNKEAYYALRDRFNSSQDIIERSAIFLYLNRHGYNGLCRYNSEGLYNVPFGSTKPKVYFPRDRMQYFHEKLQNTKLVSADFNEVFNLAQNGDVVYCDPPYYPVNDTSNFTQYNGKIFTQEEQIKLSELAYTCVNKGITVLISNSDVDCVRQYYKDSEIITLKVARAINCKVEERQPVNEILAVFRP